MRKAERVMKSNTEKGKEFQITARDALSKLLGVQFDMEVKLPIGSPPQFHAFDLASVDRRYVGEAKAFTWTVSGKTPSAKITTLREATHYLQELPEETKTFIVMKHDSHPRNGETLANYFARLNDHLLGQVAILELSGDRTSLKTVRRGSL